MSESSMRGSRLGSLSYETDEHVEPADRQAVEYGCAKGHRTTVPFSVEAEEIPLTWTCRCGLEARVLTASTKLAKPDDRPERHVRTHWDMLLERRTIAELEELLAERLALLNADDFQERKSA
jgi:hypothetical protein